MDYLTTYLFLTILFYAEATSCGPNGNCSCPENHKMDCSKTLLPLRDICEVVGRTVANNITSLRVDFNDYKNISNVDLNGCEGIEKLYLMGNSISMIGKLAFQGAHNIIHLDLSNNSLGQYYQANGPRLNFPRHLKSLMLNANAEENANANSSYPEIGSLSSLSVLYLDGLPNEKFPDHYRNLDSLRCMTLSGLNGYCNISVVSNTTFENLPHIRELDISNCSITNIYAGAFQRLSKLERLDLSLNLQLGFKMARNVTYSLQFTNIKFANFSKVYTTFGIGSRITLRDVCYLWNTTLNEIDLSSNRLVLFETNALMLLPKSLKIVHIEDNRFTFTPYILQLGCMSNVSEFYGNRQNSAHNPFLFFREPDDQIPEPDPPFDECPFMKDDFLRKLSAPNCPFFERNVSIDTGAFWPQIPKYLRIANFSNCVLQYNIEAIPILPFNNHVEFLDMSDNVLSAWTGPVGPFPKLKHLDLSRNYCSYLGPKATKYLGTVENLQLQQNFLGLVLANTSKGFRLFDGLTNLKIMNLSSNIISYIPPSTFSKMTKLETLDLSVNNIDSWKINVTNLHYLKNLNLGFNFIRSLPVSLRKTLEDNQKRINDSFKIDLRNNPITCSCDEKDFLIWMVKHKNNMVGFRDYIFLDSDGTRISVENFIEKVKTLKKSCRSYVGLIVFASIGISVFLTVVIGGFVYKNRWKLRYMIRMGKIRYLGYKPLNEEETGTEYTYDAFISYADENSEFIVNELVPHLEDQGLNLCLHGRDFRPGRNIIDNIMGAILNSRKTVAIISDCYVQSTWCMYEFNMARMDSIYSRGGRNCLVVVMLEEVAVESVSNELLAWIRVNTYLDSTARETDEAFFWQSLCDAVTE